MIVLLCLVAVAAAAAQATPVGKIIPVFEDAAHLLPSVTADSLLTLRSSCLGDCHLHLLNKPAFVVFRNLQGTHSLHFAPNGINGLAKSPLTTPLHEAILSPEPKAAVVYPFLRFPFELFPGLADVEVVIPEHATKLKTFYKEAPIIAIFPEEEFRKFNERKGLIQVADFAADPTGFTVAKDYALLNRNAALALRREFTPSFTQSVAQPTSFAPAPAKNVFISAAPAATTFPHFTSSGLVHGVEPYKFIPNNPVGTTFFAPVPTVVY